MKHIITDEEAERFWGIYCKTHGSRSNSRKVALNDFLTNRPESTLGKLRPIAEMPETVPEGCERFYTSFGAYEEGKWASLTRYQGVKDTHFIDIQLPTPDHEAEERQRFEEWAKEQGWFLDRLMSDGSYNNSACHIAWKGWQACNKLAKAK